MRGSDGRTISITDNKRHSWRKLLVLFLSSFFPSPLKVWQAEAATLQPQKVGQVFPGGTGKDRIIWSYVRNLATFKPLLNELRHFIQWEILGPASMSLSASSLIRWSGTENEQCLTLRNNFARGCWSAVACEFRDYFVFKWTKSKCIIMLLHIYTQNSDKSMYFYFVELPLERGAGTTSSANTYWQNCNNKGMKPWSGHNSNQSKWGDWCALIERHRAKAWLWFMRHTFAITTGMDFL